MNTIFRPFRKLALAGLALLAAGEVMAQNANEIHVELDGHAGVLTLNWMGGTGPFVVQGSGSLTGSNWWNMATTTNRTLSFPLLSDIGFLRIQDQATNVVQMFVARLDGSAERPSPVITQGGGGAILSLEGNTLTYLVGWNQLNASATAGHIHGPTNSTGSTGVIKGFAGVTGTNNTIFGRLTLSDTEKGHIVNGNTYVNIHSSLHPGGEIRGQMGELFTARLNGSAERPVAVTTPATGFALLVISGSEIYYEYEYENLKKPASAAHIHGPGTTEQSVGVLQGFPTPSGNSGSYQGTFLAPSAATISAIRAGLGYVNVHTSDHPGGEIRGQLTR